MPQTYRPSEIEKKWAEVWQKEKIYQAEDFSKKPKSYVLIEFPYPSGDRLHVGHARSYSCLDAVARLRRMKGFNVMYPFGWDAFGLPAENYAVKTGIHPAITTRENIRHSRLQAISWGMSFDWSREINTSDPDYYRWTQWIFVKLFEKGLAYKEEIAVNWCPECKINLANEEVIDGKCERCGTETERRKQSQWLLRITKYADRLLEDLKTVNFRDDIAAQQINWIGKKEGARVNFPVAGDRLPAKNLEVFTTRLDTIFGVTFLVAAPEVVKEWEGLPVEVNRYVEEVLNKSERDRKQKAEKTGMDTGIEVINPANGKKVPVWVAEYVMMDIGTGVVMGVPGHDTRDWEFAKKYNLQIVEVVSGGKVTDRAYEGEGVLVNSGKYDGVRSETARERMINDGIGKSSFHYHLRDWVFSRQHYWGEPIPMILCSKDGWQPVPERELPVKLPEVEKFQPTQTGESPLAHVDSFVNTICPKCGGKARRETDTMPNWAGSSWYFLRYCDPHYDKGLADPARLKYWLPVDWYNGGMEHTTLHLLYSRFWHKFLFDLGVVSSAEPYAKRTSHGVVLGPDGRKMSKSRGNVINPDDIVSKFGADTFRMYEMFIGPFDQTVVWSEESLEGVYRFLKRVWGLVTKIQNSNHKSQTVNRELAKLVKKVGEDLEEMKFNTAVAAMMEFVNWWMENPGEVGRKEAETFVKVLAPAAPFMAEELYQYLNPGKQKFASIHSQTWPKYDQNDLEGGEVTVVVSVDGKVRALLHLKTREGQEKIEQLALKEENVKKHLAGGGYKKVVYVPGRIINFITK